MRWWGDPGWGGPLLIPFPRGISPHQHMVPRGLAKKILTNETWEPTDSAGDIGIGPQIFGDFRDEKLIDCHIVWKLDLISSSVSEKCLREALIAHGNTPEMIANLFSVSHYLTSQIWHFLSIRQVIWEFAPKFLLVYALRVDQLTYFSGKTPYLVLRTHYDFW